MAWMIDAPHSRVVFSVRHMMIAHVHGQFERVKGMVNFDPDDPASTTVDVQVDAASINTNEPQRDAHLKSADFLDVERYPYITFKSKRVEVLDDRRGRLIGDLTIRDVTREVTLDVEYNGLIKSPWGSSVAGFSASTRINRKDWNLTWNVPLEAGGWLVGDVININVDVELVQQPEATAEAGAMVA
jgi:polyisoprenoid-binding protein YceI